MIVVTRLNDSQFALNPDLIERVQASPDTTIVMVDGSKYIVTESLTEVIDRIAGYRARVLALAQEQARQPTRPLELVADAVSEPPAAIPEAVPLHPRRP